MKYLLTTGSSTSKVEYYIMDLFKLYLSIFPKDIPGASSIGFNFILSNVKKDEILNVAKNRISELITEIKNKFKSEIDIKIDSLEMIDSEKIKLIITVNQEKSDEILLNI